MGKGHRHQYRLAYKEILQFSANEKNNRSGRSSFEFVIRQLRNRQGTGRKMELSYYQYGRRLRAFVSHSQSALFPPPRIRLLVSLPLIDEGEREERKGGEGGRGASIPPPHPQHPPSSDRERRRRNQNWSRERSKAGRGIQRCIDKIQY